MAFGDDKLFERASSIQLEMGIQGDEIEQQPVSAAPASAWSTPKQKLPANRLTSSMTMVTVRNMTKPYDVSGKHVKRK